ncbi:MAG: hypothetical protein HF312_15465 [Ignavibacteria bacterium]|jgi:hypothetical protein|nr:hypothetical protein [Ignavibacteria bacterium]
MNEHNLGLILQFIQDVDYYKLVFVGMLVFVIWFATILIKVLKENTQVLYGVKVSLDDLKESTGGIGEAMTGVKLVITSLLARLNIPLEELGINEDVLKIEKDKKEEK